MADGPLPEHAGDPTLSPVHPSRGNSPSGPVSVPRALPQTSSRHADPSFPVRNPSQPSRALESNCYTLCRYELPGTAVLKEYKYGIHSFTNMKVSRSCFASSNIGHTV